MIFLLGPTGSGKTFLTERLCDPEIHTIINGDSQQVYADLLLGTAAPEPSLLVKLPHKLFGFVPAGERMNAGKFADLVRKEITECHAAGRVPVVSGGSGLYLRSILYGLDDLPEADAELRQRLESEAAAQGLETLFDRLKSIDPVYAEVIAKTDKVRIIRALEIYVLSGKKLGDLRNAPKTKAYPDSAVLGLDVPRETLYKRIDARCGEMLATGWLEETRDLLDRGFRDWLRKVPAIGYDHIIEHLEGRIDRKTMASLIQRDTRRYAKRQMTWFRKMPDIRWFPHTPGTIPDGIAEFFLKGLSKPD